MLRYVCLLGYPDGVPVEEGERWYLGTHTQEAKHLRGLRRYVTWRAEKAPTAPAWTTIERFNRWERVTELAFDSWADWHAATGPQSSPRYTPPAYGPRGLVAETIFVGEEPDDDFLGGGAPERPDRLLRWLFLLRYPEGVPTADGEAWYLGTHTQEAKHIPGLRRYVSWRAAPRPPDVGDQRPSRWDRVTELAFDGWDGWRDGAVARSPRYTPAPYGPRGFHSETVFIRGEPEYDLLAQTPRV